MVCVPTGILWGAVRKIGVLWIYPFCCTITGLYIGIISSVTPVYLNEVAPRELKGAFGASFQCGCMFLTFICSIVTLDGVLGDYYTWPWSFASSAIPPALGSICLIFCEESPQYVLKTQGCKAARKVLLRLQNTSDLKGINGKRVF